MRSIRKYFLLFKTFLNLNLKSELVIKTQKKVFNHDRWFYWTRPYGMAYG